MLANIDDWRISKDENGRKLRDAAYVVPPSASESETESDSDSEENLPLAKLVKKYRRERESSSDESDIPFFFFFIVLNVATAFFINNEKRSDGNRAYGKCMAKLI